MRQLSGVRVEAGETGIKVCARVELPGGQVVPVCTPEIPYEDLERELRNAGRKVESWWKRLWKRITRHG